MSYEAIVVKLENVREHPNADRLKLATVMGYQVVVGLEAKDDDVGVFFPTDGQLSQEMCDANDLIRYKNADGTQGGGMFDKNRRVRAQNLRSEKSEGFFTGLDSFQFAGKAAAELKVGDKFAELGGVPICNKYYTKATSNAMGNRQKSRKANKMFPKHVDTKQFRYEVSGIPEGSMLHFTEKLHGTSQRVAYVWDEKEKPQGFLAGLLKLKPKIVGEWKFMIGTRNMLLGDNLDPETHRVKAVASLGGTQINEITSLHKNEVIYGELVGFTETNTPIMGRHSTKEIKELKKTYGNDMVYAYGQEEKTCKFYVYRIAMVNVDGVSTELPWLEVKRRSSELGLSVVPDAAESVLYDGNVEALSEKVAGLIEGPSRLDGTHIQEGVVVRIENGHGAKFLKAKSHTFGVLEGYVKASEDYVDTEEIS